MKKIIIGLLISMVLLTGCGNKNITEGEIENMKYEETEEVTNYVKIVTDDNKVILMELYPDIAPITVENFKNLVSKHYYDGTIFHRVIENFMIQAGGFTESGTLPEVDSIKGEFSENGVTNTLKHEEGIVSMARANNMNSASNQFFICVSKSSHLDGKYAAFGKVIAGYEVALAISKVETDSFDKPTTTQRIKTIRFVNVN